LLSEFTKKLENLDLSISGIYRPGKSEKNKTPILGLHGWLDNAATFNEISPYLSEFDFYSLDQAGHGNSDKLPLSATYSILEYVTHVNEFANEMGWDQFHLLGHSLGACVSSIYAGTFPDRVKSLALIEGLGPLSREESENPEAFRTYISKRGGRKSRMPSYKSENDASAARAKGSQISQKGSEILVSRGLVQIGDRFTWKSDSRLMQPSPQRLTETQVLAFMGQISCPTLLVNAKGGLPYHRDNYQKRVDEVKNIEIVTLEGEHHLHLDDPAPTGSAVKTFFESQRA